MARTFPWFAQFWTVREEAAQGNREREQLAKALEVLANPVRLDLLHRLGQPAFMPDLVKEFDMTRQALKKHLDALASVELIHSQQGRRGALPATEYTASPAGLFALKESVHALAVRVDPAILPPAQTIAEDRPLPRPPTDGAGLLLVHGDQPGRWYALKPKNDWVLGRDNRADVSLHYDPFASGRHAMLRRSADTWALTDLHSTNGTRVNFRPIQAGEPVPVRPGDLLTVGKSHLLLRDQA